MSRGLCVEKMGHSCGSRDALQVFKKDDGTYDGYCFACHKYVPNPYSDRPDGYEPKVVKRSVRDIEEELKEIQSCKCVSLPDRKLKQEYLEYYDVKVGVSEQDGNTPTVIFFPYKKHGKIAGYKNKLIEGKKFWSTGELSDIDFFGWDKAIATGAKRVYITEGELDAVALFQIFKEQNKGTQYADFNPAIISLSHGSASAGRDLAKILPDIRKHFKEICFVFDMDDAGKKASDAGLLVIPDALVASLPSKDANACLIEGRSKACYGACVYNAAKPKNTRIVNARDLFEKGKEPPVYGLAYPFEQWTQATRGIRKGETIYIGAAQKMGKSDMANTLIAWLIKEYGWKVFAAKPEEANVKTVKLVAGKIAGKFFHDPSKPFDAQAYDEACEVIGDRMELLNLYQHMGWDSLKVDIRAAAMNGCEAIIIDPITNLTNGMNAADANQKLQEIAQELAAMALDLNVVIFIFCHLRNPESGLSHERGGEVLSSQFAGSRAMARSCNYMLGIEGNKDPALPIEQRNIRTLVLLEDREFGEVGRWKLYWDSNTGLFNEIKE